MVRQDKFKVGDKVRPHPDYLYVHKHRDEDWFREDAIYTISKVVDVPFKSAQQQGSSQSNHESMAHTQHVDVEEDTRPSYGYPRFSGALWELVETISESDVPNG